MVSVYEKDVSKLKILLIITILLSISLIGYSYSYNANNVLKNEVDIKTVYNTGNNTCFVNNLYNEVECKFTVMGYNNSNKDLSYQILIKNDIDNSIINKDVKMYLYSKNNNIQVGPFSAEILNVNNIVEEIKILRNSNIYDEYILKMWIDNDLNNNSYNEDNGKFLVNIDVIY